MIPYLSKGNFTKLKELQNQTLISAHHTAPTRKFLELTKLLDQQRPLMVIIHILDFIRVAKRFFSLYLRAIQ